MLAALAHALHAHQLRARDEQVDAGIAVAAGLEARQLARQVERDLADRDDGIHDRAAYARLLGQVLGRVRAHRGRERLDRGRGDRQARRRRGARRSARGGSLQAARPACRS